MLVGVYRKEYERSTGDFVVACHRMLKAQERDSRMLIFVVKGRQGPFSKNARQDFQDIARDITLIYPEGELLRKLNRGEMNLEMLGLLESPLPEEEGLFYVQVQPAVKPIPRMQLLSGPEGELYVGAPPPVEPAKEAAQ